MEAAVSDSELSDLLRGSHFTVLLNDDFSKSTRLDETILEVLDDQSKRILIGTVLQGQGVEITTNGNKTFMKVVSSEEAQTTVGKLYGPNRTLLHTVEYEDKDEDYVYWNIVKNGEQYIKIEIHALSKTVPCLSSIFKCCLCMKGDREIMYHTLEGHSLLGRTAPGICRRGKNVILYLQPGGSTEDRLALLGTSIFFALEMLYPQFGRLVKFGENVD